MFWGRLKFSHTKEEFFPLGLNDVGSSEGLKLQ